MALVVPLPVVQLPITAPSTIKDMIGLFEAHHVSRLTDARTLRCLLKHYFPPLHARRLSDLTVMDIVAWSNAIRRNVSDGQADACIKVLRLIYNKMIEWQLYTGDNLATRAKISGRPQRSVFIQEYEMPKVMEAIQSAPYPDRLYYMAMLVLAPRPKELEFMRVQDVRIWREGEYWQGTWTKPAARTKKKRQHIVPLPPVLAEMFADWLKVRASGTDWVFPSHKPDAPRSKEFWWLHWNRLRQKAGIPHIWLYDLRRTGSTWANDETGDLAAVSKGMLGHANYQATNVYVQVMNRPIKRMLESHEKRLLGTVNGPAQQEHSPIAGWAQENKINEDGQEWPG